MDDPDPPGLRRRTLLSALAGAGTASLAGCPAPGGGDPSSGGDGDGATDAPTSTPTDGEARRLAERFAPTLSFDAAERWLPTDPRPYATERDGETVVDGFDALNGYTRASRESETPPNPTVFYHVVEYESSPLAVVQYWYYSAFDQFTTNFHWHDWEVVHAFVDVDTGEPQLFVASSHSPRVPNNEFLDPTRPPRILSELGSHSSALSLNERRNSFQRLPLGDLSADITNRALDVVGTLAELPAAYGLPRDEGMRLPYVIPELDGAPLYEHERLPAVDRETLVPASLTVRSFDALSAPPSDLRTREPGLVVDFAGRSEPEGDATYDLVPTSEVAHIAEFTGPQLSFEFAVPKFAEDAIAGHISTAGTPWEQARYDDPAADITDPAHRAALADRYDAIAPPGPLNDLVATVTRTDQSPDAPAGQGVTTAATSVEAVALLRSDPVAAPTFRGTLLLRGVESGTHQLTVNGPGLAPHAEPVEVGDDGDADGTASATPTPSDAGARGTTTLAGAGGEIPLVPRENALRLEVDAAGTEAELTDLAVDDDFGGRLYDAPLDGPDAVYVDRRGAYTAEVRDVDDAIGAFRVNPQNADPVRVDRPRTGKASLASFVAAVADETADQLGTVGDGSTVDRIADAIPGGEGATNTLGGLLRALEAVSGAANRAAERAAAGDRAGSDRALDALAANLRRTVERFEGLRDTLPEPVAAAVDRRFRQARRRTNQALAAEKL
ncbi:hypothetical protein [Haloplanus halophilus]|uniref:hypothetical protein n=1 Tax=Haloplanus halophilus TaxID=2949993 RepID=UPI0020411A52|nr:hypothetical protein [Haloplanus sp. GDY1]